MSMVPEVWLGWVRNLRMQVHNLKVKVGAVDLELEIMERAGEMMVMKELEGREEENPRAMAEDEVAKDIGKGLVDGNRN